MDPRVLVASNGHKDFLSPLEASASIARGLGRGASALHVTIVPMADGGDGTIEAILAAHNGEVARVPTHDPLFRPRLGRLGVYEGARRTAVIEIAEAAGGALLRPHERQTMVATSYGVGELVLEAVKQGCLRIIVGLGGSIVSDMGIGMAQALGITFLDKSGRRLSPICNSGFNALSLRDIRGLRFDEMKIVPGDLEILVASDASIPLLGPGGQARTFGPQKGANEEQIRYLEQGYSVVAGLMADALGRKIDVPLAGAAGGLGAGLVGFLGAKILLGAQLVAEEVSLEERIREHDVVVIGEGCLDRTTLLNKAPFFAGILAKRHTRHVVGVVGVVKEEVEPTFYDQLFACYEKGKVGRLSKSLIEASLTVAGERARSSLDTMSAARRGIENREFRPDAHGSSV